MSTEERLGVFGGTFDPPHVGHLVAAVNVADQLGLDRVLFVVANIPWQKVGTRSISPAPDRLSMVELAVSNRSDLVASNIEIERGGDSITADTIEQLQSLTPSADITVILGSDAVAQLGTWRRGEDLRRLAHIAVVDRPGTTGSRPPEGFAYQVVPCPLMDISSSDIRDRVGAGLPVDYMVTDEVRDYIHGQMLYRHDSHDRMLERHE